MFACMYMYVYQLFCLDFKYGPRNWGSFVRSWSIQKENPKNTRPSINTHVEKLKPGLNPVSYRKPRFRKRGVWIQVKVKKFPMKRYVSQNTWVNSWNFTVNKAGVFAKFVFSQALLYLFNWWIALVKSFSGNYDKVCSLLVVKRYVQDESKVWIWFDTRAMRYEPV